MTTGAETESERVHELLDRFHAAAAAADEAEYLACLGREAVFLGTAGDERWAGERFRDFVHGHFSQGRGWAYRASARSVVLAADGLTAWFDEQLENDSYGECRGTGVVRRSADGTWQIEQYSLSIPIPNELAVEVVARIRAASEGET